MFCQYVRFSKIANFKNGLNYSKANWGVGLKVIGVSDFKDNIYPSYNTLDEINPEGITRSDDYLENEDILFVRSNGNRDLVGRSLFLRDLPEKISHSGFTIRARITDKSALPIFYFYFFNTHEVRKKLSGFGGGTNINNLNQEILGGISVPLPPLEIQNKIAAILSAYDDLIENNKRRITLLENMAEELYREWFVRFRFPGWRDAEFEKGIPKGWEIKPFDQVVLINPRENLIDKSELTYVGMESLSLSSMYFTSSEKRSDANGSKFRNNDTLFPRITPSLENGKRGFVMCLKDDEVAVGSTEFIVMRESVLPSEMIYLISNYPPFRMNAELSMVGASGRQRVSESCFSFFLLPVPPKSIIEDFMKMVKPLFKSIKVFSEENSHLIGIKNSLLPRLISGKLSIENLDIQFPPSLQAKHEAA